MRSGLCRRTSSSRYRLSASKRLPFVGAVFGTHLDLFPDYTAGLYRKGQTSMIVSRGLGGSRKLPLRIGNRPEIVTVILKAESGKV